MNNDLQTQLETIQAQRRDGTISAAEAYRQHQALLRPVAAATQPIAPRVASTAPQPSTPPRPADDAMTPRQIAMLAVAGIVVLVITITIGLALTGVIFSKSSAQPARALVPTAVPTTARSLPVLPTIPPATVVPLTPRASATPTTGASVPDACNVPASDDKLELLSADPPVGSPAPTASITVRVRYTLSSRDSARLLLRSSADPASAGSGLASGAVMVSRGSGEVTFTRLAFGTSSTPAGGYTVLLSPADASAPSCATALAALSLAYTP